jgi:hypothetical protein
MQCDSPVGPEEAESEADWFLNASVMYKIGESSFLFHQYITLSIN